MARDLTGRVAVFTGAASGIGLALTELLADQRMSVILADIDVVTTNTPYLSTKEQ
jgi:NAD(P)-dependent dehydrogenase (short-subunit alcohol dehydrogenase family)